MPDAEEEQYPSMPVVRAELDIELGLLERRATAVDTKAGLVLGFAGVLVGLTKDGLTWITAAGQVLAVVAAVLAISAFLPRYGGAVNPMTLRRKYLTTDRATTELSVLDTRLALKEKDEVALRVKARRVRTAVVILVLAIAVIVANSVVHLISQG
ncbi:hypothetical protein FPZ12_043840 [Amycolatopsis acidicola]|uniref:Integral membrane plasmid transfer protein n=1 Tax=Amycolatopsis acidicola TaxID=2596893 RepID=A0A5N0UNP9_9PSEU|nr:hypothetical protein [Amycolatopsis acidicola]KAA9149137.1 hypothetical protein FPZ12_043840 [Amycolatopsis acidicola]